MEKFPSSDPSLVKTKFLVIRFCKFQNLLTVESIKSVSSVLLRLQSPDSIFCLLRAGSCNFFRLPSWLKDNVNWTWNMAKGQYGESYLRGLAFCLSTFHKCTFNLRMRSLCTTKVSCNPSKMINQTCSFIKKKKCSLHVWCLQHVY